MDELVEIWERPEVEELYMIAGWRQWADAGAVSSAFPQYLIEKTGARQIGQIKSDSFYLFQVPGTQHFFRPEIKLEDGYRKELRSKQNQLFYTELNGKGLIVFLGDEPQLNVERYATAFFGAAQELRVKRVAAVGGVYGAVPYNKDRDVTCTYSLPRLKSELAEYAVKFSNYEGGVSIGSYLGDKAEQLGIEYFVFYSIVPMYDLSQLSRKLREMIVEQDHKAWYELMRRFNHMFKLGVDLTDLEQSSRELTESVAERIRELEESMPQVEIQDYFSKVNESFSETPFLPIDDVWERGLGDVLAGLE